MKLYVFVTKAKERLSQSGTTLGLFGQKIKLENLQVTEPRTAAEIELAFREGRVAEMSPHLAGW